MSSESSSGNWMLPAGFQAANVSSVVCVLVMIPLCVLRGRLRPFAEFRAKDVQPPGLWAGQTNPRKMAKSDPASMVP